MWYMRIFPSAKKQAEGNLRTRKTPSLLGLFRLVEEDPLPLIPPSTRSRFASCFRCACASSVSLVAHPRGLRILCSGSQQCTRSFPCGRHIVSSCRHFGHPSTRAATWPRRYALIKVVSVKSSSRTFFCCCSSFNR